MLHRDRRILVTSEVRVVDRLGIEFVYHPGNRITAARARRLGLPIPEIVDGEVIPILAPVERTPPRKAGTNV